MLETLCLQMSNRSNDCSNIIGNHQECFHRPAKRLHPAQSDSPDCEALAVDLAFIYLFISVFLQPVVQRQMHITFSTELHVSWPTETN